MPGVKAPKLQVPKACMHRTDGGFIIEVGKPFASAIRCRFFAMPGGEPIGWTFGDMGQHDEVFWPCSSPFNFANALALKAIRRQAGVPFWKVEFMAGMFATRLLKLIRPTVARMDPRGLQACMQISKHIVMLDWRTRCYGGGAALAVLAHVNDGVPLRPALTISSDMDVVDGRPVWPVGLRCVEEHPKDALEYQYGDVGSLIYESILHSKKQLRAVDISARMINGWSFDRLPRRQQDMELLATAFVNGMHACQCCIGNDVELFTRQVSALIKKAPRKGKRSALYHADVCISDCKAKDCQRVEHEPIL